MERILEIGLILACFVRPALALELAKGGQTDYVIVTAAAPSPTAMMAAKELQEYVRRVTGAELPVVTEDKAPVARRVFVGPCGAADKAGIAVPPQEQFVVRVINGDLFIVGGDSDGPPMGSATRTGTLYGVYQFLHRFAAVRWLWPGDLGTVVPKAATLSVPDELNWTVKPDFAIRSLWLTYRNSNEIKDEHMLWQRRTGQGQLWSGGSGHAYNSLLGGNKWFETHPEYYSMVGGQRRAFYGEGATSGQICTSNPDVIDICTKSALASKADIVSLSPNDGGQFCECEKCRALDVPTNLIDWDGKPMVALTDRIFTLANEIARRVAKEQPEKKLGHFCYTFFKQPPARLTDLSDNLVLFFTQGCHWFRDPEIKKQCRGYIDGWFKFGNPMVSREYYGLIYWHGMPNVHTRLIEEDIKYLKGRGFVGLNSEICRDFATHGPNYYLAARMLWDTSLTRRQVLDEYYQAGFGAAAKDVEEYYDVFERRLADLGPAAAGTGSSNISSLAMQFDAGTLAAARKALERGYARPIDAQIRARLDFVKTGLEYTEVTSRLLGLLQKLNAAGMSFSPLEPAKLTAAPTEPEFMAMLKEARDLNKRRWEIINGQQGLPVVHTPALLEQESRGRWTEQLETRYEVLVNEAGRYLALPLEARFHTEDEAQKQPQDWQRPDFDDSGWETLRTNQPWEKQGHQGFDGFGWYRMSFEVPAHRAQANPIVLRLGAVDESCKVWLNGELIGSFTFDIDKDPDSWQKPLDFDLSGRLKAGRNVLAVRVEDRSGAGGLWKPSLLILGSESPNLIRNGSFEADMGDVSANGQGDAKSAVVADRGYQSAHSLSITVAEGEGNHRSVQVACPVASERRYAFSFRYQTKDVKPHPTIKNTPALRVIFQGADGKSLTDTTGYQWGSFRVPATTADWQEASYYFKTLPGTARVAVTVFFHGPGQYWVDEVKLRELE
ncbi:MAG: DUF4838 domain-containing protein [Armatimonadia bacterium]